MKRLAILTFSALLLVSLSGCETMKGAYDNHPGGSYSYRTPDGRLITVTVGPKSDGKAVAR